MSFYNRPRSAQNFRSPRAFQRGPRRGPQRSSIDPRKYVNTQIAPIVAEVHTIEHQFTDFGLDEKLLANIVAQGYTTPTPIQDQAILPLLDGRDVVGIANTGTGKTAAFLLPLIQKVLQDDSQGVLILAPTRELALQISEDFKGFAQSLPIGMMLAIGGTNIAGQIDRLRRNPHFVIGTPGRIKDLVKRGAFEPEMFTNVVLDEVDRMLDIGFRPDIQFLIGKLPKDRQSAFFTATMTKEIEDIMRSFLTDPVMLKVSLASTSGRILQDVVHITPGQSKVDVLHNLLTQDEFEKVIVFGRTKHGINSLERKLVDRGIRVASIHGNKNQNARERSLRDFKAGKVQVLLATDIAARGIDVDNISHVINYDEPQTFEDYTHRIGRTGRAGKTGKALTFVD